MRIPFKVGDRIRLLRMDDDPDPIEVGEEGVIDFVSEVKMSPSYVQYGVRWDNGRTLSVCVPPDFIGLVRPAGAPDPKEVMP